MVFYEMIQLHILKMKITPNLQSGLAQSLIHHVFPRQLSGDYPQLLYQLNILKINSLHSLLVIIFACIYS